MRKERGRGETRASVKMNNCGNDGDEGSRKGTSLGWNITGHFVQWISQVDLHAYMTGNFGLEVSNTNCLFVSQRTGSHSAGIHVPFTNCFVCRWFCVVHDPKTPLHSHNLLSFGKFQDTERFLIHCERYFSSRLPPSGGTWKYATVPSTKKTWRDSLPIDTLISAVSVLVVAQSSSEIPEGLMNNPVCIFMNLTTNGYNSSEYSEMQEQVGLPACSDQAQNIMRDGTRGRHNGRNCICPNFLVSLLLLTAGT